MSHMRNYVLLLLCLLCLAFAPPERDGFITDKGDVLTPEEEAQLESQAEAILQRTGATVAVLTLKSMNGAGSILEVANTTFNEWGVGKKGEDRGALLVISLAEHKTRIEVGYGLEGDLTDLYASRVLQDTLQPRLRAGDFAGGISATLKDIEQAAMPPSTPAVQAAPESSSSFPWGIGLAILAGVSASIGWVWKSIADSKREQRFFQRQREIDRAWAESERKKREQQAEQNRRRDREARDRETRAREAMDPEILARVLHMANNPNVIPQSRFPATPPLQSTAADDAKKRREEATRREDERRRLRRREEEEEESRRRRSSYYDSGSSGSYGGGGDYGGGGFDGGSSGGGGSDGGW